MLLGSALSLVRLRNGLQSHCCNNNFLQSCKRSRQWDSALRADLVDLETLMSLGMSHTQGDRIFSCNNGSLQLFRQSRQWTLRCGQILQTWRP